MSDSLPFKVVGWSILVAPIEPITMSSGGIELPQESIRTQEHLRYIGQVVGVGPLAYKHDKFRIVPDRDPEPWCAVGDWISFGRHAGIELEAHIDGRKKKFKVMHDDEVQTIVTDPALITVQV